MKEEWTKLVFWAVWQDCFHKIRRHLNKSFREFRRALGYYKYDSVHKIPVEALKLKLSRFKKKEEKMKKKS